MREQMIYLWQVLKNTSDVINDQEGFDYARQVLDGFQI